MPLPSPTEPKRPKGRPKGSTKPPEKCMREVRLNIRPDQRDKLDTLGGSKWLRQQIDKAKI